MSITKKHVYKRLVIIYNHLVNFQNFHLFTIGVARRDGTHQEVGTSLKADLMADIALPLGSADMQCM